MVDKRTMNAIVTCRDANGVPTLVTVRCIVCAHHVPEGEHYDLIAAAMAEEGYDRVMEVIDEDDFHALEFGLKEIFAEYDWSSRPVLTCTGGEDEAT